MFSKLKGIFKKKEKTHKQVTLTMTKKWINRLLNVGCLWISWSYVLATLAALNGNYTVCENLSRSIVQFIVATILAYFLKSFFETHSEEHNKLVREMNGINVNSDNTQDTYFEEKSEQFMNNSNEVVW